MIRCVDLLRVMAIHCLKFRGVPGVTYVEESENRLSFRFHKLQQVAPHIQKLLQDLLTTTDFDISLVAVYCPHEDPDFGDLAEGLKIPWSVLQEPIADTETTLMELGMVPPMPPMLTDRFKKKLVREGDHKSLLSLQNSLREWRMVKMCRGL